MKFKRLMSVIMAAVILLPLASCSTRDSNYASGDYYDEVGYGSEGANKSESEYTDGISDVSLEAVTESTRKLIQYVTISLESTEYDATLTAIKQRASQLGGYVESSNERGNGVYSTGSRYAHIVFRIPSDVLDDFKTDLESTGNVLYVNITSDDVTESYYDIEARLASLEAQRDRYMELMESACSLDEIIFIDEALTEVLYKIESYTGTLNKYDSLVTYSTVTVELQEVKETTAITEDPETFGEKLADSFGRSVASLSEFIENFAIILVSALPWLIMPAVVAVIVVIFVKNKIKRRKAAKNEDEEENNGN